MPMDREELIRLLSESQATHLQVLIASVEACKREVLERPTKANQDAYHTALRRQREFEEELRAAHHSELSGADVPKRFATALALVTWLQGQGYKVGKSKVYADIKDGKLAVDKDGAIALATAQAYSSTLKLAGGGSGEEKLRRKHEELLTLKVEGARIENMEKLRRHEEAIGQLIPRSEVDKLLAGAVAVLRADMRQFFYAEARSILHHAGGSPAHETGLVDYLSSAINVWFNRFAREASFTVHFGASPLEPGAESPPSDHEGNHDEIPV